MRPSRCASSCSTTSTSARFQSAPRAEAINAGRARPPRCAPRRRRRAQLLETEGYFNADVTIARSDGSDGPAAAHDDVVPGPRASSRASRSTPPSRSRRARRRPRTWTRSARARCARPGPLRPGEPFRQPAWSDGQDRDARARCAPTAMRARDLAVDARARRCAPTTPPRSICVVASGPLFRLGEIRIEGLQPLRRDAVRRLATFLPGDRSTASGCLLDYQERVCRRSACSKAHRSSSTPTGPPDGGARGRARSRS